MPRNIVICCDGTNNEVVGNQTNVLRLFRMLERSGRQEKFYDAGVGTMADPTALWPWRRRLRKSFDAAVGSSVRDNVLDAYRFLMREYKDDDRIFLFGFSRGAYTVRALAAMLMRCGLLCPEYENLAKYAWAVFTDEDRSDKEGEKFIGAYRIKVVFGREVPVHFVGVWDTVAAFGWVWDQLAVPNTSKNKIIRHARHALSIDERRELFAPSLFQPPGDDEECRRTWDCKQVWFAGVHADVGGGYPDEQSGLARISLRWMLAEAKDKGLLVNEKKEKEVLSYMGEKDPPEPDALAAQHDESTRLGFRIVGWFPRRGYSRKKHKPAWSWPNRARARTVEGEPEVLVHESVRERMRDADLKYRPALPPNARFVSDIPTRVVEARLVETGAGA